jgi:hypothetical protein
MQGHYSRWTYPATFFLFVLAWIVLCSPWLGGELTIPYDAKAHFQAQLQFLANALHSGQSPFWAPNVFGGSPQIADPQSLIFSPAILLAYFNAEPSFRAVDAYVFGLLGCAGCAVLFFFRDRKWHPAGGIIAALAFAFGASAAWRVQHIGQVQSYALFPVALWLLERAMRRGSVLWGGGAGLCIGLMIIEPNQVAMLAGYILVALVIGRVLLDPARRRLLLPIASVIVVALLVAFVPVVLTYLFVEASNRPAIAFHDAVRGSLHPASLLTAVIGDLYGALDPTVEYWGPYSLAWNPTNLALSQNMSQLYVGTMPVLLLLTVGLVRGIAWAKDIRFYTLALLAMIVYALGGFTPAFEVIYHVLPGVDLFRRPADATFLVGGLLALVGGYLVHRFMEGSVPAPSGSSRYIELAIVASLFAASAVIAHRLGHSADALKPILTAAGCLAVAAALLRTLQRFAVKNALLCVSIIAAFATGDLRLNNGPNESTALSTARYDFLKRNSQNETIRLLKARLKQPYTSSRRDRVELVGLGFAWPNIGLIHGFDHDLGYNPLRIEAVSKAIGAGDTIAGWDQRQFTPLFPSYRSLLADMLGLRYIASAVPIEQIDKNLKPGDLIQIGRTREAFVYENSRALPRAMFVADWMLADFGALISTGAWPRFDPTRTVLLETEPAVATLQSVALSNSSAGVASISHYENTIVEVDVTATRAGFVVLNNAWHPWWRAMVDGSPAPILKANVLFHAVQVPPGRHRVHFEFQPIVGALADITRSGTKFRGSRRQKATSHIVRPNSSGS